MDELHKLQTFGSHFLSLETRQKLWNKRHLSIIMELFKSNGLKGFLQPSSCRNSYLRNGKR